ncbi:hypothetical protein BJV78DRAFT_1158521 [Lactifluus subvellereus]|nr:hypothetical protein BJV78DRAFT_1158521 [Lactifluus subvellereus]
MLSAMHVKTNTPETPGRHRTPQNEADDGASYNEDDLYWQAEALVVWDGIDSIDLTPLTLSQEACVCYIWRPDYWLYYNWDACKHKLNSYSQTGGWKPQYCSYVSYGEAEATWAFYLESCVVPYSPANGGVSATPIPPAGPKTPRCSHNLHNLTDSCPSPCSLHGLPTTSQHGSPSLASPLANGISSRLSSLCSQFPSQPRMPITQRAAGTTFFVVMAGYNPGVYMSCCLALHATGGSSNEPIIKCATCHEANQTFVDAFMTDRVRHI